MPDTPSAIAALLPNALHYGQPGEHDTRRVSVYLKAVAYEAQLLLKAMEDTVFTLEQAAKLTRNKELKEQLQERISHMKELIAHATLPQ